MQLQPTCQRTQWLVGILSVPAFCANFVIQCHDFPRKYRTTAVMSLVGAKQTSDERASVSQCPHAYVSKKADPSYWTLPTVLLNWR
jgi:hypothetical protein